MELFSSTASAVNRCSLLLCFLLLILSTSIGQVKSRPVPAAIRNTSAAKVFADSTPIQKAYFEKKLKFNPNLAADVNNAPIPLNRQGEDLNQYVQGRNDCEMERSIDTNNCVIVKYRDGLIKKICDGELKEVITPDGKKHVARQLPTLATISAPKLPVPQANLGEPTYKWLTDLNGELLRDIEQLFGKNRRTIDQYLKRENENCTSDVFKQVVYRITFIQNYLVAK